MNTKKRLTSWLLAGLMAFSLVPASAAAEEVCEHADNKELAVLTEADCKNGIRGIRKMGCLSCDETWYEQFDNHKMNAVVTEATCLEDKYTTFTCELCGTTEKVTEEGTALDHDMQLNTADENYKAATCEETGLNTYKCSRCDATSEEVTEALGHEWGEEINVPATCTKPSHAEQKCNLCGKIKVIKYPAGVGEETTAHTPVLVEDKAPTCKETGWTDKVICGVCGEVLSKGLSVAKIDCVPVLDLTLRAATCNVAGIGKYKCAMCEKNLGYKTIPAEEHQWGDGVTTEATCTEDGKTEYTCTKCGHVHTVIIVSAGSHDDESVVIPATCTTPAYNGLKCKVCGREIPNEEVDGQEPLGHSYDVVVTPPTCTTAGYTTYTCACGDTYTDENVEALGHIIDDDGTYVAPDCTTAAYIHYACARCEEGFNEEITDPDQVAPALGHNYQEAEDGNYPATCSATGWEGKEVCVNCGDVKPGKEIPVNPEAHNERPTATLREATCTVAGIGRFECSICQKTLGYKTIPAGCKWNDGEVTTPATCTKAGVKTFTCTACGATKTEVVEANGHNVVDGTTIPATCTTPEKLGKVCSVCNADIETVVVGEPLGHDFLLDDGVFVEATCTEAAHVYYECTHENCEGRKDYDLGDLTQAALGHDPKEDGNHAATCQEAGWEGRTICGRCSVELTAGNVVPVDSENGHKRIETQVIREATCTVAGIGRFECEYCDMIFGYQSVPAFGHDYDWEDGIVVTLEPTCNVDGVKTYTCETCDAQKTEAIPNTGDHAWEDTSTEPTCEEEGVKGRKCSKCGTVETDSVVAPALGHDFTDDGTYVPASCEVDAHIHYSCSRCDAGYDDFDLGNLGEAALGHNAVLDGNYAATCVSTGWTGRTICDRPGCGVVVTEGEVVPVDANAHKAVATAILRQPTCSVAGIGRYECELCNKTLGYNTIETLPHKWGVDIVDETGKVVFHVCAECGKKEVVADFGANVDPDELVHNHVMADGDALAATCTTDGHEADQYCTKCDYVVAGAVIPATGHTVVVDAAVEATCTEDGLTEGSHCSVCNEVLVAQEVVPATGHTEEVLEAVAVTCTENGLTEGVGCSVCGVVLLAQEVIEAAGHDYVESEAYDDVTGELYIVHTCNVCGDQY